MQISAIFSIVIEKATYDFLLGSSKYFWGSQKALSPYVGTGQFGLQIQAVKGVFSSSKITVRTWDPFQPSSRRVLGVPSLVVKWLLREVTHAPLFRAKVKGNWKNIPNLLNTFATCTVTNYLYLLLLLVWVSTSSIPLSKCWRHILIILNENR
jgi:hypothetical protein